VLGVGATARAATAALARLGVERIVYLARDVTRAGPVLELAGQLGLVAETRPFGTAGLAAEAAGPAPLVVSALPPRAADPLAAADLGDLTGAVLLDVAYDPWPSALAQAWARASGTVVPGLLMLARQAIPQVEAMTGLRPPAEPLEAALERTRPGGCAIVHGQREKVA
jgi:shikimate dehydrogenase